jgi:16S rRNA U516 pseudouridylate synthase RsuA-like enzyme
VSRLHRRRYAGIGLDGLAPGEWRELRGSEVALLRSAARAPI